MMRIKGIAKMDEGRISQRVLYVIAALSAVISLVFYLVGYNTPFIGNTVFNTPMPTDALLWFMWGSLTIVIIAPIVTAVRDMRRVNRSEGMTNDIPVRRVTYTTYGITAPILLLTFIFGSTQTMMVNGENFTGSFWLRITDMFVNNSLLLLVLAVGVVAFGVTRYYRKGHGK